MSTGLTLGVVTAHARLVDQAFWVILTVTTVVAGLLHPILAAGTLFVASPAAAFVVWRQYWMRRSGAVVFEESGFRAGSSARIWLWHDVVTATAHPPLWVEVTMSDGARTRLCVGADARALAAAVLRNRDAASA